MSHIRFSSGITLSVNFLVEIIVVRDLADFFYARKTNKGEDNMNLLGSTDFEPFPGYCYHFFQHVKRLAANDWKHVTSKLAATCVVPTKR